MSFRDVESNELPPKHGREPLDISSEVNAINAYGGFTRFRKFMLEETGWSGSMRPVRRRDLPHADFHWFRQLT